MSMSQSFNDVSIFLACSLESVLSNILVPMSMILSKVSLGILLGC